MHRPRPLLLLLSLLALHGCVPWTIRPISGGKGSDNSPTATPAAYADSIWTSKLLPALQASAVDARVLLDALASSPTQALTQYGRKPSGGQTYFVVSGRGRVLQVDSSSQSALALVDIAPFDRRPDLSLQIGPVLRGVALRDATPAVNFTDFVNQVQFAEVGEELNKRALSTVLAPIDPPSLRGQIISFLGALPAEPNAHPPLRDLVPVRLSVEGTR